MCIYIYVYVYIWYVYIYICIYICIYMYMCICVYLSPNVTETLWIRGETTIIKPDQSGPVGSQDISRYLKLFQAKSEVLQAVFGVLHSHPLSTSCAPRAAQRLAGLRVSGRRKTSKHSKTWQKGHKIQIAIIIYITYHSYIYIYSYHRHSYTNSQLSKPTIREHCMTMPRRSSSWRNCQEKDGAAWYNHDA